MAKRARPPVPEKDERRPSGGPAEGSGRFRLVTEYRPAGDQPGAIRTLIEGVKGGARHQVLLGVTGSGKTFTMAQVIEATQRPTLVIAPNKVLAAQLFSEFRRLFPENAVEYFVSYYDYYQPEAYLPRTDTYIEKDADINERIDRLRHAATHALVTRRDAIIVASVSCIYGLGSPLTYDAMGVALKPGDRLERDDLLRRLAQIQYARNDLDFRRGTYRVRGDVLDVIPAYEETRAVRIEFLGDEIEAIREVDPLTGEVFGSLPRVTIHPKSHYVTPGEEMGRALRTIGEELEERLAWLRERQKLLEAQRLEQRTRYDLEMLREVGACPGIENYSRHLDGRKAGEPPHTLLDYLPPEALLVVDESHVTIPQVGGMYKGDRSRKEVLVEYGFRLPSALDNRPLRFEEFEARAPVAIYASATPADYELEKSEGRVAEQVIRPTGIVDPPIEIRPARTQVQDLLGEIRTRAARKERVLVTTLTKRMAEDLTEFLADAGVRVKYLHHDVETLDRATILRELREGVFDVLVGINLLREGLDLPEVTLVAILDADKEGFLRSERSLIQTAGRAARNVSGRVILYAEQETGSIRTAISEMERRRQKQIAWNREKGITPETIRTAIPDGLRALCEADYVDLEVREPRSEYRGGDVTKRVAELREKMRRAAKELRFEDAAKARDEIKRLEAMELGLEEPDAATRRRPSTGSGRGGDEARGAVGKRARGRP